MWKRKTIPVIVIFILFFLPFFLGCQPIKPTYTKEKIVESITSLCKQEYNIEPKVWLLEETVWIYLPLPRLITKEVQWDKETAEKINKVIVGASRVVLSMNPRPQFMAVVASDTQEYGLDYTIITWIPDIVKFQLQFISRDEFHRRTLAKIEEDPRALFDTEGNHIEKRQIKMGDFLAGQITQRVYAKFSLEPKFKDYFKVEKVETIFGEEIFRINYDIKQIKNLSPDSINIRKEILKIISYVIKEYNFKDFLWVEIKDSITQEKSIFSRAALMELR